MRVGRHLGAGRPAAAMQSNRLLLLGLGSLMALVGAAFTRAIIGHTTSDFANVLRDAANKSAQLGYTEAPETWRQWARVVSVPDFKVNYFPQLSTFGDLDVVPEGGERSGRPYQNNPNNSLRLGLSLSGYEMALHLFNMVPCAI